MHALAELLTSFVKQHRLEPELEKARLPRYWQDVVGEALASRTVLRSPITSSQGSPAYFLSWGIAPSELN